MGKIRSGAPSRLLLVATVLVVAANLRPAITLVGPLIERIGAETGMRAAALGVLGALPVFTFAAVSLFVHLLARRWSLEPIIAAALGVLVLGTLLRAAPGVPYSLFAGTIILAAAVGVVNVLLPIVVRQDFPDRVPMMTAAYTAALTAVASVASGIAVPLADGIGWQCALASAALVAVVGAALWSLRLRRRRAAADQAQPAEADLPTERPAERSVWRSGLAWQVTLFFGLQASMFYFLLTWLAAIHTHHGFSERAGGYSVAAYQAIGIIGTLTVGRLMQRQDDHRWVSLGLGTAMAAGLCGMLALPALMPLWAMVCGFASTSTLLLAMTMISLRANSPEQSTQLSGMAQGLGYIIAGSLPVLAGTAFDATGSWVPSLGAALVVTAVYTAIGCLCGRNVQIRPAEQRA